MSERAPSKERLVEDIVGRALRGWSPGRDELVEILSMGPDQREAAEILFSGARDLRDQNVGPKTYLYGFVYLSTYCRNDCFFCHYRRSVKNLERYRKSSGEILEVARHLRDGGVQLVDLTLGEDETLVTGGGFEKILRLIEGVVKDTGLPVMLSPGVLTRAQLNEARSAGAVWYALYQETHARALFGKWRRGQDFSGRMRAREDALAEGLLVEDGVLVGAGAAPDDLAGSVLEMGLARAQQVRAMGYVPTSGGLPPDPAVDAGWQELLMIACLRLAHPRSLIPASLDVEGLRGMGSRLSAGADVVTSIVPPSRGLAGVATMALDIENSQRSPGRVLEELDRRGVPAGSVGDYLGRLKDLRTRLAELA
ncbi:MAG: methylornithine synthase PylB [Deltaproteobacteria bacterium]|jgi:methylornithine synthase|nr:methylornithine synthase PylB [Deltaproteobacteria bacterium]